MELIYINVSSAVNCRTVKFSSILNNFSKEIVNAKNNSNSQNKKYFLLFFASHCTILFFLGSFFSLLFHNFIFIHIYFTKPQKHGKAKYDGEKLFIFIKALQREQKHRENAKCEWDVHFLFVFSFFLFICISKNGIIISASIIMRWLLVTDMCEMCNTCMMTVILHMGL